MERNRLPDTMHSPRSSKPSPAEIRPWVVLDSNGNGRKNTVTNAGGKWSGVRKRIGVNDEPPSAVCASVAVSSVSTDS